MRVYRGYRRRKPKVTLNVVIWLSGCLLILAGSGVAIYGLMLWHVEACPALLEQCNTTCELASKAPYFREVLRCQ